MTIILGRELTLPAGIAKSVAKPLVDMHEAWIKSENERVAAEEAAKNAVIAAKKAEEEAKLVAKKAALDAFLKSTPITITSGSWQQKKLGSESSLKKRFVWIDFETKTFNWSKTEGKTSVHKSRALYGTNTSLEIVNEMIIITQPAEKYSIDLKVKS